MPVPSFRQQTYCAKTNGASISTSIQLFKKSLCNCIFVHEVGNTNSRLSEIVLTIIMHYEFRALVSKMT